MDLAHAELVIFDIDGTLLATDRFWLDLGKRAVATVFARHGIDRAVPEDVQFLGAIGLPMDRFWQFVLPEDLHGLAAEIEGEAQDLEEVAFGEGVGAMYPGARRLMDDLHAAGRQLALASNCGRRYLAGFVQAFHLDPILAGAYCVDTPGIGSKADMVGAILRETGIFPTRAVMVGDRDSDREAARAHGVPFVLFAGGFFSTPSENGDRIVRDYGELRALLLPPA
ncbi:MAG: HAD family hydrolase [Gemmatimonadetes bacterium]|nr:HAD family hydrolase [Gemmatimonadota bacterium]